LSFGIEVFERHAPLVVPPLVKPASHGPLQSVDLDFESGVPGVLSLPPQPVLQAYFNLNAGRYRRPWVVTRATLGSRCRQSLQKGAGIVLNSRVEFHPVVQSGCNGILSSNEFRNWPSHCAWNHGDPVGVERMNDPQCRWMPWGVPSVVQSTKSNIPEREVLHH